MSGSNDMSIASIPLCHLPLRPSTLETFQSRGFVHTSELEESRHHGGMANVAAELDVPLEQAANLIREVQGCITALSSPHSNDDEEHNQLPLPRSITTAKDILVAQRNGNLQSTGGNRSIISFCRSIDQLLGGGISLGEVTEICGMPGVGKTQFAMQLCVDARLPRPHGGVQGEAIYIDTEGSFAPERCYAMAKSLVSHVQASVLRRRHQQSGTPCAAPLPNDFSPEHILDGIHVYRVHDQTALTATIHSLPTFLEQRRQMVHCPPIRLIVIDSIAFHYRCAPPNKDYLERTRSLTSIADFLGGLAFQFDIAVVAINQMTTKWSNTTTATTTGRTNTNSRFVPALGEAWAHATTTRLLLSTTDSQEIRKCTLIKSPHRPAGDAFYQVLEIGIRDIDKNLKRPKNNKQTHTTHTASTMDSESKRLRASG